jgi:RNA polymerase sigma factor (sigma-70 family)
MVSRTAPVSPPTAPTPSRNDAIGAIDVAELYRTYSADVHRFALYLSGEPAMAEDLVSETFARLWHARARVDLSTVKAYLFTIARNLYLQELRSGRSPNRGGRG